MTNFSVKLTNLKQAEDLFIEVGICLENVIEEIQKISNSNVLEMNYAFLRTKSELKNSCTTIFSLKESIFELESALEKINARYENAESTIINNEIISDNSVQEKKEGRQNDSHGTQWVKEKMREWLNHQPNHEKDDYIEKWFRTTFGNESELAGPLVQYIEDIENFLKWWTDNEGKPEQGWAEICDLAETSSKLWDAFYNYIKSQDPTGIFGKKWGKDVAVADIGGSLLGMISDAIEAVTSDDKNGEGKWSKFFEVLEGGIDVEESVAEYEVLMKGKEAPAIKLWTTFAKTILGTVSQGVDSISKYSADKTWDLNDTGCTLIEASISGLDAEASGIISFFTLGLCDMDTVREILNLPTALEVSTTLENWAYTRSQKISDYILKSPELTDMFLNGNFFQKASSFMIGTVMTNSNDYALSFRANRPIKGFVQEHISPVLLKEN